MSYTRSLNGLQSSGLRAKSAPLFVSMTVPSCRDVVGSREGVKASGRRAGGHRPRARSTRAGRGGAGSGAARRTRRRRQNSSARRPTGGQAKSHARTMSKPAIFSDAGLSASVRTNAVESTPFIRRFTALHSMDLGQKRQSRQTGTDCQWRLIVARSAHFLTITA